MPTPTNVVYYNELIITFSECILMNYFVCFCCIYITRCPFCFYVSLIFIILISFNFYVCFYFNNALRCVLMKTINNFETEIGNKLKFFFIFFYYKERFFQHWPLIYHGVGLLDPYTDGHMLSDLNGLLELVVELRSRFLTSAFIVIGPICFGYVSLSLKWRI